MPEMTPEQKRKERCQALDLNGKRCRATADSQLVKYHGSSELYGLKSVTWVAIKLCAKHREDIR